MIGWLRSPGVEPIQLKSLLVLLRRRFVAILIPVLLVAGAALYLALQQDKRYEASTLLLIRDASINVPALASEATSREVAANIELLQAGAVKQRVKRRLGEAFSGSVQIELDRSRSSLATISVTDTEPERAAEVANAYAEEYIEFRREAYRDEIESEREAIRAELDTLGGGKGVAARALRSRLKKLRLAEIAPSAVVQFDRAEPPSGAVAPRPAQNAMIGALIGLALGLALAIVLERRDRRVRDPRRMERVLGRPIIGRIPRSRALAKRGPGTGDLPPAEAEAFRSVRANLRRQLSNRDLRSLLVTSAIPHEGKTTLAWNLARAEAAAGARVLLVEADMRRPVLARSLGANGAPGLSQLLAGDAKLPELVQRVGLQNGHGGNRGGRAGALDVLFAGRPPTNPAELLDSERMQALLDVLPEGYDLVILDTPPTLISDAMPILDQVGGVVVVGRLGLSTDESLFDLRDQLDNLRAPILGVVVNGGGSPALSFGSDAFVQESRS